MSLSGLSCIRTVSKISAETPETDRYNLSSLLPRLLTQTGALLSRTVGALSRISSGQLLERPEISPTANLARVELDRVISFNDKHPDLLPYPGFSISRPVCRGFGTMSKTKWPPALSSRVGGPFPTHAFPIQSPT